MADEYKRRSAGGLGIGPLVIPPEPDGEISASDRRHIAGFYTFQSDDDGPPAVTDAPTLIFSRVSVRSSVEFIPTVRLA